MEARQESMQGVKGVTVKILITAGMSLKRSITKIDFMKVPIRQLIMSHFAG
jgi:hypothetical protein